MGRTVWIASCAAVALGLALVTTVQAQQPSRSAPAGWPDFVKSFDAYLSADSVVGGSTLVMRDGRVLAHHEIGFGDRERGEKVTEQTIFHWASITKTLTAIAIMQLRDRGRLTLDDKVTSYVPELRQVHDAYGSIDDITIRMLLSHTSGFQDPTWPYKAGKPWEPFEPTRWEQLVSMMPYQELLFAPGSQWGYSNPAFIYLGRIIEKLTGDPYEVYIQKNIWTPLGLTRSYFAATPYHLAQWRSNNYTVRRDSSSGRDVMIANGRDFDPGITIPNGGWNAPLTDLVTYATFLTNATHGDAATARLYDTVLKHASLEEMWQPVISMPADADAGDVSAAFGLSFFLYQHGGKTIVGHTGEQAGFRTFIYLNPRTSTVVIGALNTTNEARGDDSSKGWADLTRRARALIEE